MKFWRWQRFAVAVSRCRVKWSSQRMPKTSTLSTSMNGKPSIDPRHYLRPHGLRGYFSASREFWAHHSLVIAFIATYNNGGWFTVEEVWERLQQRAIVHFLMLAVAAGAAFINAWAGATLLFSPFSFSGALVVSPLSHH